MSKNKFFNKHMVILLFVIVLILGTAFIFLFNRSDKLKVIDTITSENGDEIMIANDGTKFIVDPSKIQGGGPRKGGIGVDIGIPALTEENIKFVSVLEADEWIEDDELVLALEWKGEERVYPLQIMTWHEIVNDRIGKDPLLITYCPLCGSGIAYERYIKIEGVEKESKFGTSGKLFNSNLIMYDEETDSYWQQIGGKAIVGELTGQELKEISIDTVIWGDWKIAHGNSQVLSKETGMNRPYGNDPYSNYFENDFLIFDVEDKDDRIRNKDVVFGIEMGKIYKAYRELDIKEKGTIKDTINNVDIKLEMLNDGRVIITNLDTNEEVVKERVFWFSWYAFHPNTELYGF